MNPLLELKNVSYSYPESNHSSGKRRPPALSCASLAVPIGSKLAILGANGSGKTTLLWHFNGTLRPSAGTVYYAGAPLDYSRHGLHTLRQRVAFVLQEPDDQLFAGTIRQDVSFGPLNLGLKETETIARVDQALAAMEITELADLPPHQLSHGQRKRAAIAGAIAMRPDILVLDEPTAGLDPRGVEALDAQLDRLNQSGMTIVITTHDIDFAYGWATSVAIMQSGAVIACGTPATMLCDNTMLRASGLRMPYALSQLVNTTK